MPARALETSTLIWLIVLFIYGIPTYHWRYYFRAAVYKDSSWKINFRPWFIKETHALWSNKYFTKKQLPMAYKYRLYLLGYALLFGAFLYFN